MVNITVLDKDMVWDKETELRLAVWSFLSSFWVTEKMLSFVFSGLKKIRIFCSIGAFWLKN